MRSLILSLFFAGLILTPVTQATVIYVAGDQTGTWSADTVIVTAEVRVPPGQSLTILPGVEVLFQVYCKFIVDNNATLLAVGTAEDSIRFDELTPGTHWHGLRFLSASNSSRLEYCILKNGQALGSSEDRNGGAIYCSNSSPTLNHNTVSGNSADSFGGGIYCGDYASPSIFSNVISGNSGSSGGGICCWDYSSPSVSGNTISRNSANSWGGGIYCWNNCSPSISDNTISDNSVNAAYSKGGGIYGGGIISGNTISGNSAIGMAPYGGGIYCDNSSASISNNTIRGNSVTGTSSKGGGIYGGGNISDNTISGNSAVSGGAIYFGGGTGSISGNTISGNSAYWGGGGGLYLASAPFAFQLNEITENSAYGSGGGLYVSGISLTMNKNTIADNTAFTDGGLYSTGSGTRTIINSILWGNSPQQISGISPQVTYTDVQGSWPGTGNIDAYPAFVDTAQSDYRLQWGSPCIDTGDPNPIYNDPDGTRADMGAFYYDQIMPVRVLLTPYNAPIQIPAGGGNFQFAIQATNIESSTLSALVWCDVTLPSGAIYGPVLGPVTISLGAGQTLNRLRTQVIPAGAPAGLYHYNAYAVAAGDTSKDNFTFVKQGGGGSTPALQPGIQDSGFDGWTNTGETLDMPIPSDATRPRAVD